MSLAATSSGSHPGAGPGLLAAGGSSEGDGFWTSGPVVGSLVVFVVASHTIGANPSPAFWVHEYKISGIVGLVVFVIAAVWLRELSRGLRDQLMVTLHDRALIEAKAKGIDVEASLRSLLRQLLRPDVIISSLGIALFLLVYFTAVGFALIYFTTVFAFSVHDGNALGNWAWGFNFIAVILFGIISDRLGVRKSVMIAGGVGAAVMMVVYLDQIGHPTSYYHMAVLAGALTFCLGAAYVPWMASFTETVEAHNPALTATGLAIWGWIARMVVFVWYLLLPVVVHSVTPVVVYGAEVKAYTAEYAPQLAAIESHPAIVPILEELQKGVPPAARAQAEHILGPTYLQTVAEFQKGGRGLIPALAFLNADGTWSHPHAHRARRVRGPGSKKAKRGRPFDCRGPGADAELHVGVAQVGLYRVEREVQVRCHVEVGEALGRNSSRRTSASVSGSGNLPLWGRSLSSLRLADRPRPRPWRLSVLA